MQRVGGYVRLSDEDKNKLNKNDESESIQNQKKLIIEYCKKNNWELYDLYCDEDYSGAGTYRPDFERMIKACEEGKIDIVLCKSQSRFSRDLEIIEKYLHNKFLEWNIRFVGIVDNADTDNKGNKKSRQINGLVNEWYLEDLSDNIREVLRLKKRKGQYTGSFAPYGYLKDPKDKYKLIVDKTASEVVKTIFELYKNGYGYQKIVKYLNDKNILSPYEYKKSIGSSLVVPACITKSYWNIDSVSKILKNQVYIGDLVQGVRRNISYKNKKQIKVEKGKWIIVKNTHEPIIDEKTWEFVSKKFKTRNRVVKSNGEVHLFSKKVYCLECGKIFIKNTGTNNKGIKINYLECKSRRCGNNKCNNKRSIRYDLLENTILKEINNKIKEYYNIDLLKVEYEKQKVKNQINNKLDNLITEQKNIINLISKKQLYYQKLFEDRVDGIIEEEEFITFRNNYLTELNELKEQENIIKENIKELKEQQETKKNNIDVLKKCKKIKQLNRIIIEEFIRTVLIGKVDLKDKTREIQIEWNL